MSQFATLSFQMKTPSCQSNSSWYLQLFIVYRPTLSLHTSNPSLHSLQPQVLSTTTSESGSDPELEPLATSERSSRKASMSVSCWALSEWINLLRNVNLSIPMIKHIKTQLTKECQPPNPQGIFVSFSLNPRRCAKSLTLAASTVSLRQSFTTRCCERRRRWKSRTSSCSMWSCLWSLGLWTRKRSVILNSVCHV